MAERLEFWLQARDKFSKEFNALDQRLTGAQTRMGALTKALGGIVSVALVGKVFKEITASAMEFEASMANVSTLVDTTKVNMAGFSEELIAMAPRIGKSTKELADGLYQVISAGVDAAKATQVLEVAAKAGVAGLTDTFTAVDVITTGLNAYGRSAEDAESVSDVLFTTVRLGKTTFGELAGAIGPVLPIANTLGVSIEEVAAAMSTMTAAGFKTDIAATSLRATMTQLIRNAEALRAAGIDVNKELAEGGLAGVLSRVKVVTGGNIEAMQKLFPEVRALAGVLTITGAGAGKFASDLKEMANASGATADAFEKQEATTEHAIEKLKAEFSSFSAEAGKSILPAFRGIVHGLTSMLSGFKTFGQNIGAGFGILVGLFDEGFFLVTTAAVHGVNMLYEGVAMGIKHLFLGAVDLAVLGWQKLKAVFTGEDTGDFSTLLAERFQKGMEEFKTNTEQTGKWLKQDVANWNKAVADEMSALPGMVAPALQEVGRATTDALAGGTKEEVTARIQDTLMARNIALSAELEKLEEWRTSQLEGYTSGVFDRLATDMFYDETKLAMERSRTAEEVNLEGRKLKTVGKMKSSFESDMWQLARAGGEKTFRLWKNISLAEATISAIAGAARAYKDYQYPMSIVMSGLALISGMAKVSRISGMQYSAAHGGMTNVPKEQTFLLDRGERVLSPRQNTDLTNFLSNQGEGGGGSPMTLNVNILPNATNATAMLQMSKEDWDDVVADQIFPAMRRLEARGVTP